MEDCLCAPPGGESENSPEKDRKKEERSKKKKQTHKTRERRKLFHAREIISVNVFSECHDKKK